MLLILCLSVIPVLPVLATYVFLIWERKKENKRIEADFEYYEWLNKRGL